MIAHPLLWDSGVYLPEQRLWLDPVRPRSRAVISHAHSDHVATHPVAFVTPATGRLLTHRRPYRGALKAVPYGETVQLDGARLTLHPAGHVLGSAQALVETDFGRVLYTGDLKTRPGFTAAPAAQLQADVLVLESTFGRPRYRFPDGSEVLAALVEWCRRTLDAGATPVLLGYSLGKGQEIVTALAREGFDLCLHEAVRGVTDVYRELGCTFPAYRPLDQRTASGAVVIMPPRARRSSLPATLGPYRTAALTGWAMDPGCKDRLGVDAAFPMSDHADFEELCGYAERVGAAMTYTVLGFDDELALHLRRRGMRAQPLRETRQLSLF